MKNAVRHNRGQVRIAKAAVRQTAEAKARCALRTFFRQGGGLARATAMAKQECQAICRAAEAKARAPARYGLMRALYRDAAAAESQQRPRQHRRATIAKIQRLVDASNSAVRAGKTPSSMDEKWKQKARLLLRRAKRAEAKHK